VRTNRAASHQAVDQHCQGQPAGQLEGQSNYSEHASGAGTPLLPYMQALADLVKFATVQAPAVGSGTQTQPEMANGYSDIAARSRPQAQSTKSPDIS